MKDYREKELKWYIFAYLFLLVGINNPMKVTNGVCDGLGSIEQLLSSSLLAGAICTLAFVFDCLYTAEWKERLLLFGLGALPGKTIFTRISKNKINDMRLDVKKAQEKYSEIIMGIPPQKKDKKKYENAKWYELSREHEGDPRVKTAHRDYLLSRDLYTTTISMLVFTAAAMIFDVVPFSHVPIGYLIAMLILTNIAARLRSHRFVYSVIVAGMHWSEREGKLKSSDA